MSSLLNAEIKLIIENYQVLDKEFSWEDPMLKLLMSVIHSIKLKRVDCKNIQSLRNFINKNSNFLSSVRGINSLLLASSVSSEEEGIDEVSYILEIYNKLKKCGIKDNIYLPTASYILGSVNKNISIGNKIDRFSELYNSASKLKGLDSVILSELSVLNKESNEIIVDINNNIDELKKVYNEDEKFIMRLGTILSLLKTNESLIYNNVINLYREASSKMVLYTKEQMELIALFAEIDKDFIDIINMYNDTVQKLKMYNEFREWKVLKKITGIVALTLVTDYNIRNSNNKEIRNVFSNNINVIKICLEPNIINSLNLFSI